MDVDYHFGGPIEEKVSGLEGCYVANRYIWSLAGWGGRGAGRLGRPWDVNPTFGGSIEEKVGGFEGCYAANRYIWGLSGWGGRRMLIALSDAL